MCRDHSEHFVRSLFMRAVLQRVTHAEVRVEEKTVGSCGAGFLVMLGIAA